ncbi:MAG: hypothetical protein WC981_02765 [Candidatus Dojkabacteria bacterium]
MLQLNKKMYIFEDSAISEDVLKNGKVSQYKHIAVIASCEQEARQLFNTKPDTDHNFKVIRTEQLSKHW